MIIFERYSTENWSNWYLGNFSQWITPKTTKFCMISEKIFAENGQNLKRYTNVTPFIAYFTHKITTK